MLTCATKIVTTQGLKMWNEFRIRGPFHLRSKKKVEQPGFFRGWRHRHLSGRTRESGQGRCDDDPKAAQWMWQTRIPPHAPDARLRYIMIYGGLWRNNAWIPRANSTWNSFEYSIRFVKTTKPFAPPSPQTNYPFDVSIRPAKSGVVAEDLNE